MIPLLAAFATAVVTLVVGYIAQAVSGSLRSWPHWGSWACGWVPVLMLIISVPLLLLDHGLVRRANRGKREQKRLLARKGEVTGRAFDDELYRGVSARARAAINTAKGKDGELRLLVSAGQG